MSKKKSEKAFEDDRYLVVIPFFSGGAQGREIEYAVAGWRRHFKEKYHIAVVGDYHKVVDTGDDITYIPCPRVDKPAEGNYHAHIDLVNKFLTAHKAFPDTKGFIYVADDVYAVNDFDIHDVMYIKQNGSNLNNYTATGRPWFREKAKTREILKANGYPTRNFTTHLPVWFEWDKLETIITQFNMTKCSYCIEDMYFNVWFLNRVPLQLHIDFDNLKCGVYRENPRLSYIRDAFKTKIWIQNSVEGWIPILNELLAKYYGI